MTSTAKCSPGRSSTTNATKKDALPGAPFFIFITAKSTKNNRDFRQAFDPPKTFLRADPYDNQSGEDEYDDFGLTSHDFNIHREMLSWEIIHD